MHALTDIEFDELVGPVAEAGAVPRESIPPRQSRIPLNAVHYLAFEGGGGKGIALIGALQALEDLRLLQFTGGRLNPGGPIKGVSGASAGAITAVLLSCGYNATAMTRVMNAYNFNNFWDLPRYAGRVSGVGAGCIRSRNTQILGRVLRDYTVAAVTVSVAAISGIAARFGRETIENAVNSWYDDTRIERLGTRHRVAGNAAATQKLAAAPLLYLNNLLSDFGVFSGCAARDFFSRLIADRAAAVARAGGNTSASAAHFRHMTFAQHFRLFGIRLALTGANVATGKSEIFSVDTTPNFPVADAARISMSLPILFKPVIIRNASRFAGGSGPHVVPENRLRGVWVDGGSLNNLPLRAFDHLPGRNPKTFGVRLDEEPANPERIDDFVDYLSALLSSLLLSGESHLTQSQGTAGHAVSLNTQGLSTTDFNPPQNIRTRRIADARAETRRYFSSP